ncbi:hypothetical protein [Bacteroides cellulosilyticus]|uniref:hypothetical protein n=1 Tax=Bacteroides cellulosilyticus TaxID=246787 RepID=UPI00356268F5
MNIRKTNMPLIHRLCAIIVVMFILPFIVAQLASADSGMLFCMILFLIVNPLFSITLGVKCGSNIQQMWSLPLILAVVFIVGVWLSFDVKEVGFIVYATVYCTLSWTAMFLSRYINNRNKIKK